MGEFSLSPYQLPNYRSLHRFERWQISHQIVGNSFRRTPAQTHQGQNANSLPGKCGQSLKFSLWAKGPTGKYGGSRYCGWACPFDPGSYLDHYSSLPNPGHYYGKNFDLIYIFWFNAVYKFWEKLEFHKKSPTLEFWIWHNQNSVLQFEIAVGWYVFARNTTRGHGQIVAFSEYMN